MSDYVVRINGMTPEEYEKEYGKVPNRLSTWRGKVNEKPIFEPYYDRALRKWCYSYRDQEKKVKQFNETQRNLPKHLRDKQHPDGFVFANDLPCKSEWKKAHRHGKDIRYEESKKRSIKHDPSRWKPSRTTYSFG